MLALGLLTHGVAGPALAGMAVSPLKQDITARPGEAVKAQITLGNRSHDGGAATERLRLEVVDIQVFEDGGIDFFPAGTGPRRDSAAKWVSLSETKADVKQDESRVIECTITTPYSAQPGEYYAAVMVSQVSPRESNRGVAVNYRIATGLFITVPGYPSLRQAKIEHCELLWPDDSKAPASQAAKAKASATRPASEMPKVSLLLHNTGRCRFDATGKIKVLDARSRVVLTEPLASNRPCVFAGDSRAFHAPLQKPLPAGKYTVKVEISYEPTWSRLREQLPLEISPEQAAQMATWTTGYVAGRIPLEVKPDKASLTVRPGAARSLGLTLRNISDGPLHGVAAIASVDGTLPASWISVAPGEFAIAKGSTKSVRLQVQVPAGAQVGKYESAVVLQADPDGILPPQEFKVPVEIEVKAER